MNQTLPELYSPQEIARAVGVPVERVFFALGRRPPFVLHDEAVRVGRSILKQIHPGVREDSAQPVRQGGLFATIERSASSGPRGLSLALSSTAHAGLVGAIVFLTSFSLAPEATTQAQTPVEPVHLVFLVTPGPGGGGGGGGLLQPKPAPKILRTGKARVSSPLPVRLPPKPIRTSADAARACSASASTVRAAARAGRADRVGACGHAGSDWRAGTHTRRSPK